MTDATQNPQKELDARKLSDLRNRKNKQSLHGWIFMFAAAGFAFITLHNNPSSESDLQKIFKKEAIGAQAAAFAETASNTVGQKKITVEIDLEKAENDAAVKAKETVEKNAARHKSERTTGLIYAGMAGLYSLACLYESRKLKGQIRTLEFPAPV